MTLSLRERIYIDCQHGGAWHTVKKRLNEEGGMPEDLAEEYISYFRVRLSVENSEKALFIYENWMESKSVSTTKFLMSML